MALSRGSVLGTVITTVAGVAALSIAAYTTFTGNTLCSVIGCNETAACTSSSTESTTQAVSNETTQKKASSCCPATAIV